TPPHPLTQPAAGDRAIAAHDRPELALARLDHAPPRGRARSAHAARRAAVEDVAALALHHRGGAQRQGRASGALGAAPARPPLGGRARVGRAPRLPCTGAETAPPPPRTAVSV